MLESVKPISKQSSFVGSAYLGTARSRTNLTIWTQALVDKVVFNAIIRDKDGDIVVTVVQCGKNGETNIVHARKEVIVSAGAFHSPEILELSGIGDAHLLRSLRIDGVIDNPHVGESLQTHPYCTMAFEVQDQEGFQTMDSLVRQDPSAIKVAMESHQKQQEGPFTKISLNATAQLPLPSYLMGSDGKSELDKVFKQSSES
ncbi:hypothetical protein DL768_005562 [Monosporascus sp. mg162]|nr:hypothetical protein DL768_005562 [Monosporascus sp. mg162]